MILFFKAHVSGYTRKDGVAVSGYERADRYAERAHAGQYRKGKIGAEKIPYIEHPRAVARILHDEAGVRDPATILAALLHDTLEDTNVSHENLVAEFGHEVADLVAEVTNAKEYGPGGKTAWQVEHARSLSHKAAAVKVADKTANLRDLLTVPPDWPADRKRKYYEDAAKVVGAMAHRHDKLERIFGDIYSRGIAGIA